MGLHLPALLVVHWISRKHLKDFLARIRLGAWAALLLLSIILFTVSLSLCGRLSASGHNRGCKSDCLCACWLCNQSCLRARWLSNDNWRSAARSDGSCESILGCRNLVSCDLTSSLGGNDLALGNGICSLLSGAINLVLHLALHLVDALLDLLSCGLGNLVCVLLNFSLRLGLLHGLVDLLSSLNSLVDLLIDLLLGSCRGGLARSSGLRVSTISVFTGARAVAAGTVAAGTILARGRTVLFRRC